MDEQTQDDIELVDGRVVEALPSTLFRVETAAGKKILSSLSGRMRVNKIKVLVGDKVTLQIDPYSGKGRIVKRL